MAKPASRSRTPAPDKKALKVRAVQQAKWARAMAVLCYALSVVPRRRQREQPRAPTEQGTAAAAAADGGTTDTPMHSDAKSGKGATGGVNYNNKSIQGKTKATGGSAEIVDRERHVAPDCPDRPVRDRAGEGWYEWSRHEARWKEDTDKDPKRPTKRGRRIRAGEETVRRMEE